MKVLVEFDPAYAGPPSDAVWIVASAQNRLWFKRQAGSIDLNSAIFDESLTPVSVLCSVFEHHPDWTEIVVRGTALTSAIEHDIGPDAVVTSRAIDGFRLQRR